MSAPAAKDETCSSACTVWWLRAAAGRAGAARTTTSSARNERGALVECRPPPVEIDSLGVEGKTYEDAGVSLAFAESVVERLRAAVESTGTTGFGAFAGLYPLDEQRLLAASMDSAGTKLVLARKAGRLRGIGADLAAHCVNDVITTGAEPLFFLDYVVGHSLEMEQVAELVEGAAETCRAAGCALLGGETAEMPGVYREEELDFAGTCVGLVARAEVIDGSRIEAGDVVLGLPSVGLHTNGFSLVRGLIGDGDF